MLTIRQNIPLEPNGKKPYRVSLTISYKVPRTYTRIEAESEQEALDIAMDQLYKDTNGWGVDNIEVTGIKEV